MTDKPADTDIEADVAGDETDETEENLAIDTNVSLADITVIDLEHILENLEKENPEPDRAALDSRRRLEKLLEEKRAQEALKDFEDYDLDE